MLTTTTAVTLAACCLFTGTPAMQHDTSGAGRPLWAANSRQAGDNTTEKTRPAEWLRLARRYGDSGDPRAWTGVPSWIRQLGLCIRRHESLHSGHYRAENPTSTASGAYQMLSSMWLGNARWVPEARRYRTAGSAPAWIQDLVFVHSIRHGGAKHWRGTGCPGT